MLLPNLLTLIDLYSKLGWTLASLPLGALSTFASSSHSLVSLLVSYNSFVFASCLSSCAAVCIIFAFGAWFCATFILFLLSPLSRSLAPLPSISSRFRLICRWTNRFDIEACLVCHIVRASNSLAPTRARIRPMWNGVPWLAGAPSRLRLSSPSLPSCHPSSFVVASKFASAATCDRLIVLLDQMEASIAGLFFFRTFCGRGPDGFLDCAKSLILIMSTCLSQIRIIRPWLWDNRLLLFGASLASLSVSINNFDRHFCPSM